MPNSNPIKHTNPHTYMDYEIHPQHADDMISITTSTSVDKDGWEIDLTHTVSLHGDPVNFDPDPEITDLELDTATELHNRKFSLCTSSGKIRNGGTLPPPKANYKLTIKAGDTILDEFQSENESNPSHFYTKITFKLQS